jgi:hypothetical protein
MNKCNTVSALRELMVQWRRELCPEGIYHYNARQEVLNATRDTD